MLIGFLRCMIAMSSRLQSTALLRLLLHAVVLNSLFNNVHCQLLSPTTTNTTTTTTTSPSEAECVDDPEALLIGGGVCLGLFILVGIVACVMSRNGKDAKVCAVLMFFVALGVGIPLIAIGATAVPCTPTTESPDDGGGGVGVGVGVGNVTAAVGADVGDDGSSSSSSDSDEVATLDQLIIPVACGGAGTLCNACSSAMLEINDVLCMLFVLLHRHCDHGIFVHWPGSVFGRQQKVRR